MNLVDLLRKDNDWSKDLVYDEGQESVFHFDGSSGTIIPKSYIEVPNFAAKPFSIVTMFRHHSTSNANRHLKEHIICNADDHSEYLILMFIHLPIIAYINEFKYLNSNSFTKK